MKTKISIVILNGGISPEICQKSLEHFKALSESNLTSDIAYQIIILTGLKNKLGYYKFSLLES